MSFQDCADQEAANRIAETLGAVIQTFSVSKSIYGLDGVTFATNYRAAIGNLDRGFPSSFDLVSEPIQTLIGMAMPIRVIRDGGVRTHLVLRGSVAHDIDSSNEDARLTAIKTIIYCLSSVALTDFIDSRFPGRLLAPHSDHYEALIANYTDGVYEIYHCTRCVRWSEGEIDFYRKGASSSIDQLFLEFNASLEKYKQDSNYESHFHRCGTIIGDFLRSFARFFGSDDSGRLEGKLDLELVEKLNFRGLKSWADLFASDLDDFFDIDSRWTRYESAYFVNRHFERIIANFRVLPDQLENGSLFIHVFGEN